MEQSLPTLSGLDVVGVQSEIDQLRRVRELCDTIVNRK